MRITRHRRLREKGFIREWAAETRLCADNFITPYFVVEGKNIKREIKSMPDVYHLSVDRLLEELSGQGCVKSVLLFGVPGRRDATGSQAFNGRGVVQDAVRALKKRFADLVVITDVCLCGYTSHGHCGIVSGGKVDNDETLKILAKIAVSHAEAGADFTAPSAMMDGQAGFIREALDKKGLDETGIIAYSAKYASSFYGPFREALDSSPEFGDRSAYQMDYRNSDEALREIKQDINEGADIVMVKPALAYLDIICRAKAKFDIPLAAYSVSGEYAMIKKAAGGDGERERLLALEVLTSVKRAGADLIISYYGNKIGEWLCR